MMASKQDGDINSLVSRICPDTDVFECKKFKDKLVGYLCVRTSWLGKLWI